MFHKCIVGHAAEANPLLIIIENDKILQLLIISMDGLTGGD